MSAKQRHRIHRALERRDGLVCFYCRKPVVFNEPEGSDPPKAPARIATIEHLKPLYMGGLNTLNNLVLSCWPCQRERHEGN